MPLGGPATPVGVPAPTPAHAAAARRAPFWRGAAGAIGLAAWTLAGVVGAAFALVSVALEDGPRGKGRSDPLRVPPERLVTDPQPTEAPAVRAAGGEAFPG